MPRVIQLVRIPLDPQRKPPATSSREHSGAAAAHPPTFTKVCSWASENLSQVYKLLPVREWHLGASPGLQTVGVKSLPSLSTHVRGQQKDGRASPGGRCWECTALCWRMRAWPIFVVWSGGLVNPPQQRPRVAELRAASDATYACSCIFTTLSLLSRSSRHQGRSPRPCVKCHRQPEN